MTALAATTVLAETCYGHDGPHGFFLFPLLLLVVLLLVVRPWRRRHCRGGGGEQVLAERFARGEIGEEEFRSRRDVLRRR